MNLESHKHWIEEIGSEIGLTQHDLIVKFALAYTLQSIRGGENLQRFRWDSDS